MLCWVRYRFFFQVTCVTPLPKSAQLLFLLQCIVCHLNGNSSLPTTRSAPQGISHTKHPRSSMKANSAVEVEQRRNTITQSNIVSEEHWSIQVCHSSGLGHGIVLVAEFTALDIDFTSVVFCVAPVFNWRALRSWILLFAFGLLLTSSITEPLGCRGQVTEGLGSAVSTGIKMG